MSIFFLHKFLIQYYNIIQKFIDLLILLLPSILEIFDYVFQRFNVLVDWT